MEWIRRNSQFEYFELISILLKSPSNVVCSHQGINRVWLRILLVVS